MNKVKISCVFVLFSVFIFGQNKNIGQFAVWKPKDGQSKNFENGYIQHLNWHKTNGDSWSWYGWFIISGARYGQFVDATFNLGWSDFDKPVNPSEDMADNKINVFPYADVQTVFKVAHLKQFSTQDLYASKLKLSKMLTIKAANRDKIMNLLGQLQNFYKSKNIKTVNTFSIADGGNLNEFIIILGFPSWEEYAVSENIMDEIAKIESKLTNKVIDSIQSETMIYREDLSYFP
ncbi:hypothetical protein SD960_01680 [Flavobacterium sp. MMLR14_040]|uniref:hypothetical protein n=1 Tax=Flavobacterium sp. MMLR14_040 TaxID=3093843 RepID=UPI00298F6CF4|nr:hypothetical protein [Flavobacterium sp. MMLR14_040]MDW8848786.1 hypothetical protein [Flavobacterium sp. MMLR14_040]